MNAQTAKKTPARPSPVPATPVPRDRPTTGPTESDQERVVRVSKERSEKFLRLAPKRMTKALKALDNVAALGNRKAYTYTEDQYAKMKDALQKQLEKLDRAYMGSAAASGEGFKF